MNKCDGVNTHQLNGGRPSGDGWHGGHRACQRLARGGIWNAHTSSGSPVNHWPWLWHVGDDWTRRGGEARVMAAIVERQGWQRLAERRLDWTGSVGRGAGMGSCGVWLV